MVAPGAEPKVLLEDYLQKKGSIVRYWRKRFVRLSYTFDAGHVISYLASPLDPVVKGTIHLGRSATCEAAASSSKYFAFAIKKGGGREYVFASEDEEQRQAWMQAIQEAIRDSTVVAGSIEEVEKPWRVRAATQPVIQSASVRVLRAEGLSGAGAEAQLWARLQFGGEARRTRIGQGMPDAPFWGEIIRCHFRRRPRFFAVDVLDEEISSKGSDAASRQGAIVGRAVVSLARASETPLRQWHALVGRGSSAGRILLEVCVHGDMQADVLQPLLGIQLACPRMPGAETSMLSIEPGSGSGGDRGDAAESPHPFQLKWPVQEVVEDCARVLLRPFEGSEGGVFPGSLVLTSHRLMFVGAYDVDAATAAGIAMDSLGPVSAAGHAPGDGAASGTVQQEPNAAILPTSEDAMRQGDGGDDADSTTSYGSKSMLPCSATVVQPHGMPTSRTSDAMSFVIPLGLVVGVDAGNLASGSELATADPVDFTWKSYGAASARSRPKARATSAGDGVEEGSGDAGAGQGGQAQGASAASSHATSSAASSAGSRHEMGAILGADGAVIRGALSMTTEAGAAAGGQYQGSASNWSRNGRRRTESGMTPSLAAFARSGAGEAGPGSPPGYEVPLELSKGSHFQPDAAELESNAASLNSSALEVPLVEPGRHPSSVTAGLPTLKLVCADFRSPRFAFVGGDVLGHHRAAAERSWSQEGAGGDHGGVLGIGPTYDDETTSGRERAVGGSREEPGSAACARFFWRLRQHVASAGVQEVSFARLPSDALGLGPSEPPSEAAGDGDEAAVQPPPSSSNPGALESRRIDEQRAVQQLVRRGWQIFDMVRELSRQGLGGSDCSWRVSRINRKFEFCPTYPRFFAVPATVTDASLAEVGQFRSRQRVPALSWRHPVSGASLVRCAQPLVGLAGRRSRADEAMLSAVRCAGADKRGPLALVDMRPLLNALANRTAGKGYEATGPGYPYSDCALWFGNIENIHVMRDSLRALLAALAGAPQCMTAQRLPGAVASSTARKAILSVGVSSATAAKHPKSAQRAAVDAVRRLSFVKAAHALEAQAAGGSTAVDQEVPSSPGGDAARPGAKYDAGPARGYDGPASPLAGPESAASLRIRRRSTVSDRALLLPVEPSGTPGAQVQPAEPFASADAAAAAHASSVRAAAAVAKVRMGGASGAKGPRTRLPKVRSRPRAGAGAANPTSQGKAKKQKKYGMLGGFMSSIFGERKQATEAAPPQVARASTAPAGPAADEYASKGTSRADRVHRIRAVPEAASSRQGESDPDKASPEEVVPLVDRRGSVVERVGPDGSRLAAGKADGEDGESVDAQDSDEDASSEGDAAEALASDLGQALKGINVGPGIDGSPEAMDAAGALSPAGALFAPSSASGASAGDKETHSSGGAALSSGIPAATADYYEASMESADPSTAAAAAAAQEVKEAETLVVRGWTVAPVGDDKGVPIAVERSGWLQHEAGLLSVAVRCVRMLDTQGISAKISCSDGWDRTPQAVALTQLLLDPYYRTIEGFGVLVDKEFGSFGHKYKDRAGRGLGRGAAQEASPVVLQFLGCVEQVRRQFPDRFEFTSSFVSAVARMSLDRSCGSFLFDSERERSEQYVKSSTASAWAVLLAACGRPLSPVPAARGTAASAIGKRADSSLPETIAASRWVNKGYRRPPLSAMWPVQDDAGSSGQIRRDWLRDEVLVPEHSPRAMRPWDLMVEWERRVHAALETGPGAAPPTAVPEQAPSPVESGLNYDF